ncbi:MAG TPA: hypothetical protein VNG31_07240 [Candidatus Baltobacteraceae bacterium]|nr:hypothetical protein [Candidatus Baltobacteraceae bacterium]
MTVAATLVASLEFPIVLIAPGLGATQAVLEELDPNGDCRLRSLRFFSPGTQIEFIVGHDVGTRTRISGRIAGYSTNARRFIYHIELDDMAEGDVEWVSLLVSRRRQHLANKIEDLAADIVHPPPLARASIRAEADFDLEYRIWETWRRATAANLSTGGLLMRAHEVLVEGMALAVRFVLPSTVLERCSEDALLGKLWDRGVREAAQTMLRRPFKELTLRARIVCHRPIAGTIGDYGVEFCSVEPAVRAEIDRYCTALRFARSSSASPRQAAPIRASA